MSADDDHVIDLIHKAVYNPVDERPLAKPVQAEAPVSWLRKAATYALISFAALMILLVVLAVIVALL